MRAVSLICLCAALALTVTSSAAASTRGWSSAGRMKDIRSGHAAVLLDNGKVLVAGGRGVWGDLASAELFDPATTTWTPAASMREPRGSLALLKLRSGQVLAVGGDAEGRTAELYDPARNRWTPTGSLAVGRENAQAVALSYGDVLVAGGDPPGHVGEPFASAERYSPETGVWSPAGTMPEPRTGGLGASLPWDRAVFVGGRTTGGTSLTTAAVLSYNGVWGPGLNTAGPLMQFALTPLNTGTVLATGGTSGAADSATVWDQAPATFAATGPMRGGRYWHAGTSLGGGRVMVTGGMTGTTYLATTEIYDDVSRSWTPSGSMGGARSQHTATTLADGRVLVAGGSGFVSGNETELWTPTTTAVLDGSLTFGDETVGRTVGGTLRLTNTGEEPLFVGRPAFGGAHPGDFALGAQRCGAAIAPGATCRLELRFTPGAAGPRRATLALAANTVTAGYSIPLAGSGVAAPVPGRDGDGTPAPVAGDGDGDGVPDASDRCPQLAGTAARFGCPAGLLADPSIAYTRVKGGIKVVAYYVQATKGARVVVKCSRGCKPTTTTGKGSKRIRIARLNGKRLKNGTRITITATMPGRLTTTVTDSIARGRRTEGRPRCSPVGC